MGARSDSEEIKVHPFFKNLNWEDLYKGKIKAPSFEVPVLDIKTAPIVNFDPKNLNKNELKR